MSKVIQFCSRNKDNKEVTDFKQRYKTFHVPDNFSMDKVVRSFHHFVEDGLSGEVCRMYISVNTLDSIEALYDLVPKICRANLELEKLTAEVCSNLMKHPVTRKWIFDFDISDEEALSEFCDDIKASPRAEDLIPEVYPTYNNYAVIVEHGFDTRKLMEKWGDKEVSLQKNGMLFLRSEKKS